MDYGIYSDLIEEVILFSRNLQIKEKDNTVNRIKIICDLKEAEYLAYEEVYGEDKYDWKDIRELEMSEVWGQYYSTPEN